MDEEFGHPRLAAVYDALDPDRSDLEVYVRLAQELGARRVLDIGCGTGTFALMLSDRGCEVVGVDPAAASLAVARAKPGAGRVRWVEGDATAVDLGDRDLVTMTANVAQAIADPLAWAGTLGAAHAALRPGGVLVLETRDRDARAWEQWTPETTRCSADVPGIGPVTSWVETVDADGPLVSFGMVFAFAADDTSLTSTSTLRFRTRPEVEHDLVQHGFDLLEVRDAPDRPGRELVFIARRAPTTAAGPG